MRWASLWVGLGVVGCGGGTGPEDGGLDGAVDADGGALADVGGAPDGAPADAGPVDAGPVDPLEGMGEVELVADAAEGRAFQFLEGPVWWEGPGVLIFSDIPASTLYQLTPPDAVAVFRAPSGEANGNAVHPSGDLLSCEHAGRRVARTPEGGTPSTFADAFMGDRFSSPNDLTARSDGTVYFTDPPYGLSGPREIPFNGLFRIDPDGRVSAEWMGDADATRPNGVALSPDERVLYLADTAGGDVRAFDVAADGTLSGERAFVDDTPNADGMAVDVAGNLYVTTRNGVQVYDPAGNAWGTIGVPQIPANCGFGDDDRRTLYITARTGLYRVRLAVAGG
jgi:gluconolactonase